MLIRWWFGSGRPLFAFQGKKEDDPVWAPWHAYVTAAKEKRALKSVSISTNKIDLLVAQVFKTNAPTSLHEVADRLTASCSSTLIRNSRKAKRFLRMKSNCGRCFMGLIHRRLFLRARLWIWSGISMSRRAWNWASCRSTSINGCLQSPGSPPHAVILGRSGGAEKSARWHVFKRGNPANKV